MVVMLVVLCVCVCVCVCVWQQVESSPAIVTQFLDFAPSAPLAGACAAPDPLTGACAVWAAEGAAVTLGIVATAANPVCVCVCARACARECVYDLSH